VRPGDASPPADERSIVLWVRQPSAPSDVESAWRQACARVEGSSASRVVCDVGRISHADAITLDLLGRIMLTVRRAGRSGQLCNVNADLRGLLELTGLAEVLSCVESVEVVRQSEEREEPPGLEEERDPADLPA